MSIAQASPPTHRDKQSEQSTSASMLEPMNIIDPGSVAMVSPGARPTFRMCMLSPIRSQLPEP